jgi:hypothetical protein
VLLERAAIKTIGVDRLVMPRERGRERERERAMCNREVLINDIYSK